MALKKQITKKKHVTKVVQAKRTSYSGEQKKRVVDYTRQHRRNKAAKNFNLDRSMVGRWMKLSEDWAVETNNKSKQLGSGQKAFFSRG